MPAHEPEKLNSITALLIRFLRNAGIWNGFIQYEFGDDHTTKDNAKPRKESFKEFKYTPVINYHQKQLVIKRSSELKWSTSGTSANLLGQILSDMRYATDAPTVIDKYFQQGIINTTEKAALAADVQDILADTAVADLYSDHWTVYRDRDLSSGGKYTYTADRLMIDKATQKAAVINFRHGADRERDERDINGFGRLLVMGPYREVDKWIIYTDTKEIIRVA
jgi:hypothetical protein